MRGHRAVPMLSALVCLVFSSVVYAQSGFPTDGIWLSTTKATAGDALKIYTLVYNSGASALDDKLIFTVDGATISTQSVNVAAGASKTFSTDWSATAGSHAFAATLANTGASAATNRKTSELKVSIAEPPPPTALQQSIATAQSVASTSIPIVSNIINTIYQTTEGIREGGLALAQQYASDSETSAAASDSNASTASGGSGGANAAGFVKGTSTSNITKATVEHPGILGRLAELAAPGILLTFSSKAIFYPLLCLLLLFLIWLALRFANRERY